MHPTSSGGSRWASLLTGWASLLTDCTAERLAAVQGACAHCVEVQAVCCCFSLSLISRICMAGGKHVAREHLTAASVAAWQPHGQQGGSCASKAAAGAAEACRAHARTRQACSTAWQLDASIAHTQGFGCTIHTHSMTAMCMCRCAVAIAGRVLACRAESRDVPADDGRLLGPDRATASVRRWCVGALCVFLAPFSKWLACRYNAILYVPYQLERLLAFGLLVCADSFLVRPLLHAPTAQCCGRWAVSMLSADVPGASSLRSCSCISLTPQPAGCLHGAADQVLHWCKAAGGCGQLQKISQQRCWCAGASPF